MNKRIRLTIAVVGLWSVTLFGCGGMENEPIFSMGGGKAEEPTTAQQSAPTLSTQDLFETKFVADQGPPYNLDGMTAVLVIKEDGSFVLEGSVLAEFCDDEGVEKVSGQSIELFSSMDRQFLALKSQNSACREMQGVVGKIPAHKTDELKRQFDGLPQNEQFTRLTQQEKDAVLAQFQNLMKAKFTLMLIYGADAEGEMLQMFGEDTSSTAE